MTDAKTPTIARRFLRRLAAGLIVAVAALALSACESPAGYPDGTTDVELWESTDLRIDTEVPNQYPDGTTREVPAYEGDDADEDEGH